MKKRAGRKTSSPTRLKKSDDHSLRVADLLECLCAAHLSSYVRSPFDDRGGLIIVGPPGVLKSTLIEMMARLYHDAIVVSDINASTLNDLKQQLASGTIRTLAIPELRKLYERDPRSASNIEGVLRGLVCEGYHAASFEDSRVNSLVARSFVMSAITPDFQQERFRAWEKSGFNRRFLWCLLRMKNPHLLEEAVEKGARVEFKIGRLPALPPDGRIPDTTTPTERREIRTWLKRQPGSGVHNIQAAVMVKMLAVLKWWRSSIGHANATREAMDVLRMFATSLQQGGAELIV